MHNTEVPHITPKTVGLEHFEPKPECGYRNVSQRDTCHAQV